MLHLKYKTGSKPNTQIIRIVGGIFIAILLPTQVSAQQNPWQQILGGVIAGAQIQQATNEWQQAPALLKTFFNIALK